MEVETIAEILLPNEGVQQILRMVAPGTPLREGLDNVLRAKTGALIVVGENPAINAIIDGGFRLDTEFTPASLYELAKMDGAIILSSDAKRILYVNTMLMPDQSIYSSETGIRHRTADRVARSTGLLTISISQRRNIITLYKGTIKYYLRDIGLILSKANQAIQTLDRYRIVFNETLEKLLALEFENIVLLADVTTALQRFEMLMRVANEINNYILELGTEGRLVKLQLEELVADTTQEGYLLIKDYMVSGDDRSLDTVLAGMAALSSEELLDLANFSKILGYGGGVSSLDQPVMSRGHRILSKIPRLPLPVIDNVVAIFGTFQDIFSASIEELDDVEGIGEVRAKSIKEGLQRIKQQLQADHHNV